VRLQWDRSGSRAAALAQTARWCRANCPARARDLRIGRSWTDEIELVLRASLDANCTALKDISSVAQQKSCARNLVAPLESFRSSMQVLVGMNVVRILPRFSSGVPFHVVQESHRLSLT
jgi:hypothetical protein